MQQWLAGQVTRISDEHPPLGLSSTEELPLLHDPSRCLQDLGGWDVITMIGDLDNVAAPEEFNQGWMGFARLLLSGVCFGSGFLVSVFFGSSLFLGVCGKLGSW